MKKIELLLIALFVVMGVSGQNETLMTINGESIPASEFMGRELSSSPAIAVKALGALSKRKINIRLIDHGAAKISMLIGVDGVNYVPAIEAIYTEFARI